MGKEEKRRQISKQEKKAIGFLVLCVLGGGLVGLISNEIPIIDKVVGAIGSLILFFLFGFFVLLFIGKNAKTISKIFGQKGADSNFYWGKCTYCLKKVSRLATKCPHCTADLPNPFEK